MAVHRISLFVANDGASGAELWVTDGTAAGTSVLMDINPGQGGSTPAGLTALGDGRFLFSATTAAAGQEVWITDGTAAGTSLLKDIRGGVVSSLPSDFTQLSAGHAIFSAVTAGVGRELWVTDGTTAGTTLLKNIGPDDSLDIVNGAVGSFTALGDGRALLMADDKVHGTELWVTDGTAAGTTLVKDLNAGITDADISGLTAIGGGRALFSHTDATSGTEIWITDGTDAGTSLLKDIAPGTTGSNPSGFTSVAGGRTIFAADDGVSGMEVWVTDGTTAGTSLLSDIFPGLDLSVTGQFLAMGGGRAIFGATNGTNGFELWVTDGTAANTSLLKDINPGAGDSILSTLIRLNDGRALFTADDGTSGGEIWVTDGTAAGTTLVKDLYPSGVPYPNLSAGSFGTFGPDRALFAADPENTTGTELWITDGTGTGTSLLVDINLSTQSSSPDGFIRLADGRIVFNATDAAGLRNLWVTNGTSAGTSQLVQDFQGSAASTGQTANGTVFRGSDGEIWITDGTVGGTYQLKNINPTPDAPSYPDQFTALLGGRVLFVADDGSTGAELWVTNGTSAGTSLVKDIGLGGYPGYPTVVATLGDGRILLTANDGTNGHEVWVTDGTTAGTSMLRDIAPGGASSSGDGFMALGDGRVLFRAQDTTNGTELWVTDGSSAGTTLLKDIRTGAGDSNPLALTRMNDGRVMFSAVDGTTGAELWITDGTEAGTSLVKDIRAGGFSSSPLGFTSLADGRMVFIAGNAGTGRELWVSDGTDVGTSMVRDIRVGSNASQIGNLTRLGDGRVVFTATDGVAGEELWVTDGTTAGTSMLRDIQAGANGANIRDLFALGDGRLLFVANDGVNGDPGEYGSGPYGRDTSGELWVTDGTTEGTLLVADIRPGAYGSAIYEFATGSGGQVLFQANDGGTGFELWTTDGTTAGTHLVRDLDTRSSTSSPSGFVETVLLQAPVISGTVAAQVISGGGPVSPFAAVVIADDDAVDLGETETATVVMSAAHGTFGSLGAGAVSPDGLTYTVSGTPAAVQAALRALTFTPTVAGIGTGFTLTVSDGGRTATDTLTSVTDLAPPSIGGLVDDQTVQGLVAFSPFATVVVTDADAATLGQTQTASVTMSAAVGAFSSLGTGTLSPDGRTYTVSGTPAEVQTALRALVFTPSATGPVTFSLSVNDTDVTVHAAIDARALAAPVIAGIVADQSVSGPSPINPFVGVRLSDPDATALGQTQTATVVASAANGTLSNLSGGALSPDGLTYTVAGSAATVQAALRALTFTSSTGLTTTQFSLSVSDGLTATTNTDTAVTDIACYLRGTMILTPSGERPVQDLAIGDLVSTHGGEPRPIRWIGRRAYAGRFVAGQPHVLPILIRQGALDAGVPHRDLMVSPRHAMFLDGVLVPACALVNGTSIIQVPAMDRVEYFHIELDSHDVILAEGAPSETFIDDGSRSMFHNAHEYMRLYPGNRADRPLYCAPRIEDGHALDLVLRRLGQRARARVDWTTQTLTGPMAGMVDIASHDRVAGWVRCDDHPGIAVPLCVLVDGQPVAHPTANLYRRDLELGGIGNGHHAFDVPLSLSPAVPHEIRILRRGDQAEIPGSPLHLAARPDVMTEARGHLDIVGRTRIAGWVRNEAAPDQPVTLLVIVDGEPVGHVLADQYRADLLGRGGGRFGFSLDLGLSDTEAHVIRLLHQGADILGSPHQIPAIPRVGGLRGHLDCVDRHRIAGWVVNEADPSQPVSLLVTANGAPIARIIANRARPDLLDIGLESDRHGFDHLFATPLSVLDRHEIRIAREDDGACFADPVILEPPAHFDSEAEAGVAALLTSQADDADLDRRIRFLMTQTETLLRQRADRQGQRWQRETWRPSRQAWSRPLSAPAPMAEALREEAARPRPRRALVIDDRMPSLSRDAGSHAIMGHIGSLRRLGFDTTFVPALELDAADTEAARHLETLGVAVAGAPFHHSVEDVLRRQAGLFDIVYLHRLSNASKYGALVRQYCPGATLVYSVADLHHLRIARQAAVLDEPALAARAAAVRLAELMAVCAADRVITHSTHEAAVLAEAGFGEKVHVVPWPVTARLPETRFQQRRGIAFIGWYQHAPNLDAAHWLVEDIMPRVWRQDPTIPCRLVGGGMPRSLAERLDARVRVLGPVDDLGDVLEGVRLTVAPLRFGAGIKGKVLDSLAAGVPIVGTGMAAEGLDLPPALRDCIADDAAALARRIVQVHGNEAVHQGLVHAGLAFVRATFNETRVDERMRAVVGAEPSVGRRAVA